MECEPIELEHHRQIADTPSVRRKSHNHTTEGKTMNKFKGFEATTSKGTPCFVMNEDDTRYLVRLGVFGRYHGWSGGARRDIHYTGATGWIAKKNVTIGRAS